MSHVAKLQWMSFLFTAVCSLAAPTVDLQLVTSNVTNPVYITHAGDGSGRLFIVEQTGRIKIFNGTNLLAAPFLNISPMTLFSGEQGLLSMAFHPGYATNGCFYVYFTNTAGTTNIVARFTASPPSGDSVSTNTMQVLLRIAHVNASNHNGGQLQFGSDGYLYIGTGDGGGSCDNSGPGNNAQNLGSPLGKLLRIDVNNFATNYTIPPSNPFVSTNGALPEIWAYGLRNPWRFSFDRLTGDLWIGDVGEGAREEIDFQPAASAGGQNYGWHCYEGFLTNTCGVACSNYPSALPIFNYDHSGRCAIMGGYRYRGTKIPSLYGTYLYADECGGQIYGLATNGTGAWVNIFTNDTPLTITTFGEDQAGELYCSHYATAGAVYRIVWKDTDGDELPDDWEQQYFGSTTGAAASADPDGDGFTNLQEFLAGTDPTNAMSALRITFIATSSTNIVIRFASVTNKLYSIERTDILTTNVWTTVTNNVAGTGGVVQYMDVGAAGVSNRFYRVRLLP